MVFPSMITRSDWSGTEAEPVTALHWAKGEPTTIPSPSFASVSPVSRMAELRMLTSRLPLVTEMASRPTLATSTPSMAVLSASRRTMPRSADFTANPFRCQKSPLTVSPDPEPVDPVVSTARREPVRVIGALEVPFAVAAKLPL